MSKYKTYYHLWCHQQDEPPYLYMKSYDREQIVNIGESLSLKPLVYNSVILENENGSELGRFEDGVYKSCAEGMVNLRKTSKHAFACDHTQMAMDLGGCGVCSSKWVDSRPDWITSYLLIAFTFAQRSIDPNTKHCTVLFDDNHSVLAVGYNSLPRKVPEDLVNLERPFKYDWILHSEISCICEAARTGRNINKSTAVVTGECCLGCFKALLNAGIKKIYCAPIMLSSQYSEGYQKEVYDKIKRYGPEIEVVSLDMMQSVIATLDKTYDYVLEKIPALA